MEDILVQKLRERVIVALAKEIGFTDGGIRQGSVKGA